MRANNAAMHQAANGMLNRTTPTIANPCTIRSPCMTLSGKTNDLMATEVATKTTARAFAVCHTIRCRVLGMSCSFTFGSDTSAVFFPDHMQALLNRLWADCVVFLLLG